MWKCGLHSVKVISTGICFLHFGNLSFLFVVSRFFFSVTCELMDFGENPMKCVNLLLPALVALPHTKLFFGDLRWSKFCTAVLRLTWNGSRSLIWWNLENIGMLYSLHTWILRIDSPKNVCLYSCIGFLWVVLQVPKLGRKIQWLYANV